MFQRVLLLAPARMPQVVEWRRVLADEVGYCDLATFHAGKVSPADAPYVHRLQRGEEPAPTEWLRLARAVRSRIASGGYDLVIAYYLSSYGLLASLVAPRRYVATAAGSDLEPLRWRVPRRLAARLAVTRAAGCFAWTAGMATRMRELGADPDRVVVRPRGIDLRIFTPATTVRPPGPLRIVSTRRLRPLFRHDRAIEALARLRSGGLDARLDLIGDGTERSSLESLVRREGLEERVSFLGDQPRDAVASRLSSADVFLSLSRSDGLSTSVVEALACGAFPVLSDIGPNRELVEHERNGLLVSGDDPEAIARAIRRAAEDPLLRERARDHNARMVRDRFDIRRNTRLLLEAAEPWLVRGPRA